MVRESFDEKQRLLMDILNGLAEDKALKQEMLASMESESNPQELETYRRALLIIDRAIGEKEKMVLTIKGPVSGMAS